jgi:hypothetical protein
MQRLRAGLTGLGLVFLVVMIASLLFTPVKAPLDAAPSEPLAQLGVAPGPAPIAAPPPAKPTSAPGQPGAGGPGGPLLDI